MGEVVASAPRALSAENIQLIKDTVAKGATDGELQLFLHRCKVMGLDPLKPGQIYFIKYGSAAGSMVVGIDGFRARAMATGKHRGTRRGIMRDEKGKTVGAWCEVHREGWDYPAREEVSMAEYSTGKSLWASKPETMLKKVAEAAALRMAFPDELGGLYASEEMDHTPAPRPLTEEDFKKEPEVMEAEMVDDIARVENEALGYAKSIGAYGDTDLEQKVLDAIAGANGDVEKMKAIRDRAKARYEEKKQ